MKYSPFGGVRSGTPGIDKAFTGQQRESITTLGAYYFGARFYSSDLGMFLSVDPMVTAPGNFQSWNPYAYVRYNPLRHVDPTGACPIGECPGDHESSPSDPTAAGWTNSGGIGYHRDTGCSELCRGLRALAAAGFHSAHEVYQHQQLIGALQYLAYEHEQLVGAPQYLAERAKWPTQASIESTRDAQPYRGGGCS
jgi:RHS repeat-associated protein